MARSELSLDRTDVPAAYRNLVERIAKKLRPRFASGELVPWGPWDDRWEDLKHYDDSPNGTLEDLCEAYVKTRVRAHLILATSPHGPEVDTEDRGGTIDPRVLAGVALAQDVLELARGRGWLTHIGAKKAA